MLCDRGVARAAAPVWRVHLSGDFLGFARTVHAPDGDLAAVRAGVRDLCAGDVLVIAAAGREAALWGDRLTAAAQERGAAGVVVDGFVRDVRTVAASGLPLRARGTMPARGEPTSAGATDVTVVVAGVEVAPGDLVVADADGVVIVPADRLPQLERHALAWLRAERAEGTERKDA
jgi:regulator of RNase E activity RraA